MLKAVLQYQDYFGNGQNFFSILSKNNVIILKSKRLGHPYVNVTIIVEDIPTLNDLIYQLNKHCEDTVLVVKTKFLKEKKIICW